MSHALTDRLLGRVFGVDVHGVVITGDAGERVDVELGDRLGEYDRAGAFTHGRRLVLFHRNSWHLRAPISRGRSVPVPVLESDIGCCRGWWALVAPLPIGRAASPPSAATMSRCAARRVRAR